MRIVVAGGTGTAGRVVVRQAAARGHHVVALSRSGQVRADLVSGTGLAEAVAGAEAVIDCSNAATQSRTKAERFFVTATKNLAHAAAEAGARHYVLLSIVGIENVPMGYYQAKLVQEAALVATATEVQLGFSIARTTQFHDFVGQLLGRMRFGRLAVVPHLRIQPVELTAVAGRLLDCLDAEPASRLDRAHREPASRLDRAETRPVGRLPDLAGPREEDLLQLARQWLAHHGDRTRLIGLRLPGRAGRAIRDGGLLLTEGDVRGRPFADWLADQPRT